ncbi:MAG: 30S ribosomal protein S17e [Thermoplasmata archaeon]
MGNIRSTHIKNIAIALVKRFPNEFTSDYQHNKKMVEELTDVNGKKKLRNRVAGYVTSFKARYEA